MKNVVVDFATFKVPFSEIIRDFSMRKGDVLVADIHKRAIFSFNCR